MQPFAQITISDLPFGAYTVPIQFAVLVILLLIASITDLRERRIPNQLVVAGIVIGTAFHTFATQGEGTAYALLGLSVGIALLLPLYLVRAMGAGDVKLIGMIGAFLGTPDVIGAVLATMAVGGLLAIGMTACKRMLPQLFANLRGMLVQLYIQQMNGSFTAAMPAQTSVGKMPYAVAIFVGTVTQLFILRY